MKQGDKVLVKHTGQVVTIQSEIKRGRHTRYLVQLPLSEESIRPLGRGSAAVVSMEYDEAELELLS